MECCAEIQKCNIDNKVFSEHKMKYEQTSQKGKKVSGMTGTMQEGGENMGEILSENAWLNEKMEVLQNQIKKQAQEIKRLREGRR